MQHPRTARRRLLVAACAVAPVLSACSSDPEEDGAAGGATGSAASSEAAAAATAGSLEFDESTCAELGAQGADDCAVLPVPVDHSEPDGATLDLAVARVRATGERLGSVLVNPGGPGPAVVPSTSFYVGGLGERLRERFDVVLFDPRGTGASAGVDCLDGAALDELYALDDTPDTEKEEQALAAAAAAYTDGCVADSGDLLAHLGTDEAARDLDLLREALGDDELTYLGYSWGTALGASYAEQFPDRVRAMALDGALDPSLDPLDAVVSQARGFQGTLEAFAESCAADDACPLTGATGAEVVDTVLELQRSAGERPLPTSGERSVSESRFSYGLAVALYDQEAWPVLGQALHAAERGDATRLLLLSDLYLERGADGTYADGQEAFVAYGCADAAWPRDPEAYEPALAELAAEAPAFQDFFANTRPCRTWPFTGDEAAPASYDGDTPLVVVGTTGDPATPYEQAEALAEQLGAPLVTWEADVHVAYPGSECVQEAVDAYLVDLEVPEDGLVCSDGPRTDDAGTAPA